MEVIWASEIKAATATEEAAQITISQHADRVNGFCTHLHVIPGHGRQSFKVSGRYDMTIEDAMQDAAGRFQTL